MTLESISVTPSSVRRVGAFRSGLNFENWSMWLKREIGRCINGVLAMISAMATRRTYGESSIPISCMRFPRSNAGYQDRKQPKRKGRRTMEGGGRARELALAGLAG